MFASCELCATRSEPRYNDLKRAFKASEKLKELFYQLQPLHLSAIPWEKQGFKARSPES